jgi:hypothetical protein
MNYPSIDAKSHTLSGGIVKFDTMSLIVINAKTEDTMSASDGQQQANRRIQTPAVKYNYFFLHRAVSRSVELGGAMAGGDAALGRHQPILANHV